MYNPTSYVDWGLWDKHFCWESWSTNFAWSNYNTVYSILCTFLLKQVTSVYFLNTHFTRTSCNSSQVCTEGSKDPNHQCINIALILCFNQLHCYVGGSKDPNCQCRWIYLVVVFVALCNATHILHQWRHLALNSELPNAEVSLTF